MCSRRVFELGLHSCNTRGDPLQLGVGALRYSVACGQDLDPVNEALIEAGYISGSIVLDVEAVKQAVISCGYVEDGTW